MFWISNETAKRAQRGMRREWRLQVVSIFALSIAFVCLGAALLVLTNLQAIEERWAHTGRASVYLKDQANPDEIAALRSALERVPGVTSARYVSSGQARADFAGEGNANVDVRLPAEAFPASIEVVVSPDLPDDDVTAIVGKVKQLPAVDDVETYRTWTDKLARLIGGGIAAAGILATLVLGAVLAVVGSTVRLALQRRKTEVEVLKLVGASDGFVKAPFVIEGTAQGALGAFLSVVVLAAIFIVLRARLDGELAALFGVEPRFLTVSGVVAIVGSGGILGAIAAALGLRRLVAV